MTDTLQRAPGALTGLKVIDLTQMLAGPFCTMMLGDQGATVIKIEPLDGEPTRLFGPFAADDQLKSFGGYFQSVNRNKLSVALDLKHAQGREVFLRLVQEADVVVENFRAGVMDRLGIGYETLAATNRKLVYAALRGFGDPRSGASPYVDWPAFDVVAQAMGGIIGITGPDADTPLKIGPGVGDLVPAMMSAFAILAAVRHADKTGEGQFVDLAMYDSMLALCERIIYQHSYAGQVPGPEGNGHPLLCPFGLFPASDGWVTIACPRENFWLLLTEIMGQPELGRDPRYGSNEARTARKGEVVALVSEWSARRSKAEIQSLLGGRVPFGPVNTVADILADPHVAARSMVAEVDHPGSAHRYSIANSPIRMSKTFSGVQTRSPLTGEHTDAVLAEAGYKPSDIETLRAACAIA
ncbi:crotonobetainyl-CoA:carnitine CoA-transferase CaiB-like acyl-CoA transferase [Rhodoligotrophos appendicifer]|uniref:CaiB/BaiF CoA transferase family protein n=1 Tax=Rhodoligotrophos appendicifer TaxID=987056 RepID=UPI0011864D94|nr:CoA transferase [Rhodoligotrophos appendicifer]